MLTHVMPDFLTKASNTLRTPRDFFRAAYVRGFKVVVAVWRRNVLARQVSSFELKIEHARVRRDEGARESFCDGALTRLIANLTHSYRRGVDAAKEAGFVVIERTFDDVVGDLCGTVEMVAEALEPEICGGTKCECRPFESPHVMTSHRDQDMAGRTTPEAAACATRDLGDHPDYAWMLDLNAREPPPSPRRPAHNASRPTPDGTPP